MSSDRSRHHRRERHSMARHRDLQYISMPETGRIVPRLLLVSHHGCSVTCNLVVAWGRKPCRRELAPKWAAGHH